MRVDVDPAIEPALACPEMKLEAASIGVDAQAAQLFVDVCRPKAGQLTLQRRRAGEQGGNSRLDRDAGGAQLLCGVRTQCRDCPRQSMDGVDQRHQMGLDGIACRRSLATVGGVGMRRHQQRADAFQVVDERGTPLLSLERQAADRLVLLSRRGEVCEQLDQLGIAARQAFLRPACVDPHGSIAEANDCVRRDNEGGHGTDILY
jgi:hypothetical protein